MISRFDQAIVITHTDDNGKTVWHFNPQKNWGVSYDLQTNHRHKGQAEDPGEIGFVITNPDDGCVVLLGTIPKWVKLPDPQEAWGYSVYIFEDGTWKPLPDHKWVAVCHGHWYSKTPEYSGPKLRICIGLLGLDLPSEIVLDFWADWLSLADVLALHQTLVVHAKLEKANEALRLAGTLKSALGIKSKIAEKIQEILRAIVSPSLSE